MKLWLVRHGQTDGNQSNRMQGRGSNLPLNEAGMQQAMAVCSWFTKNGIRFDRVYASPLARAVQTAEIISGTDSGIVTDERLLEMDYGPYEGMDLRHPAPEVMAFFSDFVHNPAPEGMEPLADVVKRAGSFLETIRTETNRTETIRTETIRTEITPCEKTEETNILICTHAIAMKGALECLTPASGGSYWGKYIGNCAVYAFELKDGRYSVPEEMEIRNG